LGNKGNRNTVVATSIAMSERFVATLVATTAFSQKSYKNTFSCIAFSQKSYICNKSYRLCE
jgi:hypothetical protein